MKEAVQTEKSELGRKILNQLQENLEIADKEKTVKTGYIQHKPFSFPTRFFKPA